MTASKSDIRNIVEQARPLIERWLDVSDLIAAFREACTAKGIEWGPLKALIKARVRDEQDEKGGDKNIRALLAKAEDATAYADMLGWAVEAKKLFSRGDHAVVVTDPASKREH